MQLEHAGAATVSPPAPRITLRRVRSGVDFALRLGNLPAAQHAIAAVLPHYPDAHNLQVLLAQVRLIAGDDNAVVAALRRAIVRHPLDGLAWGLLGAALERRADQRGARVALLRAALHEPFSTEPMLPEPLLAEARTAGDGVRFLHQGQPDAAAWALERALRQWPERHDLRLQYAEALRRTGALDRARAELQMFPEPDDARLPVLWLRRALLDDLGSDAALHRADPDHHLARRFFAPELPPWQANDDPEVPWDGGFDDLLPYLELCETQQRHQKHVLITKSSGADAARRPSPAIPSDVRAFVRTAASLSSQLITSTARRPAAGPEVAALPVALLSHFGRLRRQYGAEGARAVAQAIDGLATALQEAGIPVTSGYVDQPRGLRVGEQPLPVEGAAEVAAERLVAAVAEAYAERGQQLGTVFIVGGDDIVPFGRVANMVADDDAEVLTDNIYACNTASSVVPQRVVARLPDGGEPDPAWLVGQLGAIAGRLQARGQRRPRWSFFSSRGRAQTWCAGFSAAAWQESSRAVLGGAREAPDPLVCCPPADGEHPELRRLAPCGVWYMNLHGAEGSPNWYGQPDEVWPGAATRLPVALTPEQLRQLPLEGTILLSEACYGMELRGKQVATAIPLQALERGALACIGATVNAYGATGAPLVGADLLAHLLMVELGRGMAAGLALLLAKQEFARVMEHRQGYLDAIDIKTLHEFVLYGDPWATVAERAGDEAIAALGPARPARVVKTAAPRQAAEVAVPESMAATARRVLRGLLRGAPERVLVAVQEGEREQQKGAPAPIVTFSASSSQATSDGVIVAQAAHVTMRGERVLKSVVTR